MRLYTWSHYIQRVVAPLFTTLKLSQISPDLQELRSQLRVQLLQTIVIAFLFLCVPVDIVTALFLSSQIWVHNLYPPVTLIQHIAHLCVLVSLALILLHHDRPIAALIAIVIVKVLGIFGFIWLTGIAGGFLTMAFLFALPATALPMRFTISIGIMVYLAFGILLDLGTHIETEPLPVVLIITTSSLAFFSIIGYVGQRILDNITLMIAERSQEAAERARVEAHAKVLEEYHQRLLSAQHDLRAPCTTAMRITQLLQDSALDPATTHNFARHLEPLLLCVRVRVDALMDDAKSLRTAPNAPLSIINLTATVQAYIPELQRWANISAATEDKIPATLHFRADGTYGICGREGEVQRILENLMLNSIVAQARSISIVIRQVDSSHIELLFEDDGVGFPQWLLEQSLHQATNYRARGIGLGLVGIYANVTTFQGSIRLENSSSGARVRMCFPSVVIAPSVSTCYSGVS
ncbi:MAG: ATP-binding protein [Chloroflexota bacterium]